jgi:hypothetical protein
MNYPFIVTKMLLICKGKKREREEVKEEQKTWEERKRFL